MPTYEGRLELTWTNKPLRLLAHEDGSYEWVPPCDYRVAEVRLLHDASAVGEVHGKRDRAKDNLLIRGDALNALTSLIELPEFEREYVGKVKLAYLDPPFNTQQSFLHYDDALEHSVWLTMMRDRLLQIRTLGRVLNLEERYDKALDVLEQATDIYRSWGDVVREGGIAAEVGWAHRGRGTAEEGIVRIQPLIDAMEHNVLTELHIGVLSGLYTTLARLLFKLGQYDEELAAAGRAAELAQMAGDPAVLAVAEARRGTALMTLGRREEAIEVLEIAADLAGEAGNLGTLSVALDNLGELFRDGGDLRRSKEYLARALEVSEQLGLPTRIAWTVTRLGRIAFLLGDWEAAEAHLARG